MAIIHNPSPDYPAAGPTLHHPNYIRLHQDLITLSCTYYRLLMEDTTNPIAVGQTIVSDFVRANINAEDHALAQEIKSHFGKKLVWSTLLGVELSNFRKDLGILLNTDFSENDYSYPQSFLGMAYKLPYFYQYDKEIIKIFGGEHSEINEVMRQPGKSTQLTFINNIRNHLRAKNQIFEYWFSDESGNRVLLKVDCKNPLLPVFDLIIKEPINVSGTFAYRNRDRLNFYEVRDWKFEI